jgi:hypothetical protein
VLGIGMLVKDSHLTFAAQPTLETSNREIREERVTEADMLYISNRCIFILFLF